MKLIEFRASESGGMNGSRSSTSVAYTDEGRCKVNIVSKPFHNQPTTHVKYYADGLLDKLSEVCERYHVIEWKDLPEQDLFMHDAPTIYEHFTFEDGTKIDLGSKKKYPEHAGDMFHELYRLIDESESYSVNREVLVEEDSPMMMGMMPFGMMSMGMMSEGMKFDQTPPGGNDQKAGGSGSGSSSVSNGGNQGEEAVKWAKFCNQCGTPFEGNQKFCSECGAIRNKQ